MQTNKVTLVGYMGNHMNVRRIDNGSKRVSLRMATHHWAGDREGKKNLITTWHDIVAWNTVADYAERSFVKGSRLMIEGSIEYRVYKDRMGHTRYHTLIKATGMLNLDR